MIDHSTLHIHRSVIARIVGLSTSRTSAIAKELGLVSVRPGHYTLENAMQIALSVDPGETRGGKGRKRTFHQQNRTQKGALCQ